MKKIILACFFAISAQPLSANGAAPALVDVEFDNSIVVDGKVLTLVGSTFAVNDTGSRLFTGLFDDADFSRTSLILFDGTSYSEILTTGDLIPGTQVRFDRFDGRRGIITDSNRIGFSPVVTDLTTTTSRQHSAPVLFDPDSGFRVIASPGAIVPGVGPALSSELEGLTDEGLFIVDGNYGPNRLTGTYILAGDANGIDVIARDGQPNPFNDSELVRFATEALNADGNYLAIGFRQDGSFAGLARGNGATLTPVFERGDASPDSDGTIGDSTGWYLNDAGAAVVGVRLSDSAIQAGTAEAYLIQDEEGLDVFVKTGDPGPAPNSTIDSFRRRLDSVWNNAGQLLFQANLDLGTRTVTGLLLADGDSIDLVARNGRLSPSGIGQFTSMSDWSLNDSGQIVFEGIVRTSEPGDDSTFAFGVFAYDQDQGLVEVAMEGTPFLGSTLTGVAMSEGTLANDGTFSYRFELADGRGGVAVWNLNGIPEPSSCVLVMTALLLATRGRACLRTTASLRS